MIRSIGKRVISIIIGIIILLLMVMQGDVVPQASDVESYSIQTKSRIHTVRPDSDKNIDVNRDRINEVPPTTLTTVPQLAVDLGKQKICSKLKFLVIL